MKDKCDTLMIHSISSNIGNNAAKFSHNSIQGHHHSLLGIQYYADKSKIRWSMSVGCLVDLDSPAVRYASGSTLKRPVLGCGLILGKTNMLVISDLHIPYHHQDSFAFLSAVADRYDCKVILNVGDLIDHHASSYHESEPDAMSPEEEYFESQRYLNELAEIFPKMVITNGNHDNIPKRKLKTLGLPSSMVSDFNKLYKLKNKWTWTDQYYFDSKGGQPVVIPMNLTTTGRWDKRILGVK